MSHPILGIYVETVYVPIMHKKKLYYELLVSLSMLFAQLLYISENVIIVLRLVWNLSSSKYTEGNKN